MGVAVLATAFAYVAMVGFATDVLEISPVSAYVFAGVYELSLITVALLAREAAQQDRPARTQLLMTWVFSAASGILAGYHELDAGHGAVAAGFRFTIPVVAALMWHFALVGDRHLASMRSWTDLRQAVQIHSVITASSRWFEAQGRAAGKGGRRAQRAVERRNQARLRAMTRAMRSVPAGELRGRLVDWEDGVLAMSELTATVGRAVVMDAETGVRVVEQLTQVMTQTAAPLPGAAAQLEFAASRSVAQEQVPLAIAAASTDAAVTQRHPGVAAPAPAAGPPATPDAPVREEVAHQAAASGKAGAAASRGADDAASRTMPQAHPSQSAASSDSDAASSAPEPAASTQLRDAGVAQSQAVAAGTALPQRRVSRASARGQVDLMEVHRMRSAGESWRKIGPALSPPVSPDTARRAYEDAQKAPETPARGILLKELQAS
ncbi:MAG: hypothetical protein ACRDPS_12975 [Nocardioides sp.]|uniref:hypothetical protein n=1 Tax=Nocardioides sp. TaxID=35761 RepID=UPI003D6AA2BB